MHYEATGGGHLGRDWPFCWQATSPFAHLILTDAAVQVKVWPFHSVIPLRSLVSYSRLSSSMGTGFQLHAQQGFPRIVFWSHEPEKTEQALRAAGLKRTEPTGALPRVLRLPLGRVFLWYLVILLALLIVSIVAQLLFPL